MSSDDDEPVPWQVVSDGMGKGCGLAIMDGRHIDAATEELVDLHIDKLKGELDTHRKWSLA